MATGQIFEIPKNIAKGYRIPDAKPVNLRANGAGVTALMGIFNGSGAAAKARRRAKTKNTPQGETDMAVKRARRRAKKKLKRSRRRAGNFARSFFIVRKGRKLRATARRNADFDTSDFSSTDDLVANRRRRRAKKARKSRKGKARRRVGKGRVYRARRSVRGPPPRARSRRPCRAEAFRLGPGPSAESTPARGMSYHSHCRRRCR